MTTCAKGGTPHLLRDHGTDGHRHPHNPWSERCVKRLHHEPSCPDARCMTCDGAPVRAWVERTCAEQGIPVKVTDPVAVRRVATLFDGKVR